ncbi:MAG: alpha/beta fold hydrolase [Gammaproteobacteria bacterium]|nr:alpha/beta fold hydrolase [Gammaproteobacteria bacterium]
MSLYGCGNSSLKPWHTEKLTEEFTEDKATEVQTFDDYQKLEDRLFRELEIKVYSKTDTGPENKLIRYSSGSRSDPLIRQPNWNRSFEMTHAEPVGGVLLLHGMSDSPYSLRALALSLHEEGYQVMGLRLPGNGTAPSGLRYVRLPDMVAAVKLAAKNLTNEIDKKPIHVVGYSIGAALALNYTITALNDENLKAPASLTLLSPAIRVSPTAALARTTDLLSNLPGLNGLAWLNVMPEFDPYKYNSFPANAGDVTYKLTKSVMKGIAVRRRQNPDNILPPTLVLKSVVDTTVTTDAVVDNLLMLLNKNKHELILFDINRTAATDLLLTENPGPLNERLLADNTLPFSVTFIANETDESPAVVARRKAPFSDAPAGAPEKLGLEWPPYVISLSHVAIPFAPDDPLYGRYRPTNQDGVYLGELALRGENGLSTIPPQWLLRMRYNPFYKVVSERTLDWINQANTKDP